MNWASLMSWDPIAESDLDGSTGRELFDVIFLCGRGLCVLLHLFLPQLSPRVRTRSEMISCLVPAFQ